MSNRAKHKQVKRRASEPSKQNNVGRLLGNIQQAVCAVIILVLPIFIFSGNTDHSFPKISFLYIAVAVLYALWGGQSWFQNEWRFQMPVLLWPACGLILAGVLSIINAAFPALVIQSLSVLVYFFLFYVYIVNQAWSRKHIYFYLTVGMLSALLGSGYGLLQYYGLSGGAIDGVGGILNMISGLGSKNFLAELLAIWAMPSLLLLIKFKNIWIKVLILVAHSVNFTTLILADSTGALLGFVAGALLLSVGSVVWRGAFAQIWQQKTWVGVWGVLIIVSFFVIEPPDFVKNLLSSSGQVESPVTQLPVEQAALMQNVFENLGSTLAQTWEEGSGKARMADWAIAVEMFKFSPVFGVGLGHYQVQFLDYKMKFLQTDFGKTFDEYIGRTEHAHNDYIQAAAEMGLVGIVALAFGLIVLLWHGIRSLSHANANQQFISLLLYASAGVFFVDAVVNFPAHLPASAFSVALLLGLAHGVWSGAPKQVSVKGKAVGVIVIATLLINLGVSVFAYRDWQANVHLDTGIAYSNGALYDLARRSLESSLALDFHPDELIYRLAFVHRLLGNLDQAEAYYEQSLKHYPTDRAYYDLAGLNQHKGDYETADAMLEKLRLSQPVSQLLLDGELLQAFIYINQREYARAQSYLESLEASKTNPKVWYWLAQTLLAQRKTREGIELLQQALEKAEQSKAELDEFVASIKGTRGEVIRANNIANQYEDNRELQNLIKASLRQLGVQD